MSSCLGIYIGDKVVKYAKLSKEDNSSNIKVVTYGTKIHLGNKSDIISNIVTATGSEGVPVCINSTGEKVHTAEVIKIIGKSDLESLIDLEVVDFTGNEDKNERSYVYKYALLDSLVSRDNYTVNIIVKDRPDVDKYLAEENAVVGSMYPTSYILDEIAPKDESNYLIIDMNEDTNLMFVNGGKLSSVINMELGMKKILDTFPEMLGSYQKSYDICKTINVFSDEGVNNPELERVIEPVLQDALNRIQNKINELKLNVNKIYLSGMITLFINSDMLFEQYFDIPTEKLRPYFVDTKDSNINAAEVSEANEAFALAYEGLMVERPDLDFLRQPKKFSNVFAKLSKPKAKGAREVKENKGLKSKLNKNERAFIGNLDLEKVKPILIFANVIMFVLLLVYAVFAGIYDVQIENQIASVVEEKAKVTDSTLLVNSDITYINANKEKYNNYVSYVDETIRKINNGEIGKYSTYNVALFMLKISKYIPDGVLLKSIKSDSSKHVTIVVTSNSYAELGYFVSQLKLEGILNPSTVQTTAVTETTATTEKDDKDNTTTKIVNTITVTIGGDLP